MGDLERAAGQLKAAITSLERVRGTQGLDEGSLGDVLDGMRESLRWIKKVLIDMDPNP